MKPLFPHCPVWPSFVTGPHRLWRGFPLFLALGFGAAALADQPDKSPASLAARASARAEDFERGVARIVEGNFGAAEAALLKDNVQKSNTLEWDIESATKWGRAAFVLRERSDFKNARLAALQAIAQLGNTKHYLDATARRRAQAYETIALINDRLLIDQAAAQAAYLRAKLEDPNSKGAQAGLDQIADEKDKAARRLGGKG